MLKKIIFCLFFVNIYSNPIEDQNFNQFFGQTPEIIVETGLNDLQNDISHKRNQQISNHQNQDTTSVTYYNNTRIELNDPWKIFKRVFIGLSGSQEQGHKHQQNQKIFPTPPIPIWQLQNGGNSTNGTVNFASPICIGNCFISQIYWANSSVSFFGQMAPQPPSFPPNKP